MSASKQHGQAHPVTVPPLTREIAQRADTAHAPGQAERPADSPAAQDLVSPSLAAYYADAASRRHGHFIDVPERVAGFALRPLTADTWAILCLAQNRCLLALSDELTTDEAAAAMGFKDVRDFVWVHSPHYIADGEAGAAARLALTRDLHRRLSPSLLGGIARNLGPLLAPLRELPWWRPLRWLASLAHHCVQPSFNEALADAAAECLAIVDDAFMDAPGSDDDKNAPDFGLGFTAALVDRFAAEHEWTPERTRATPLRQIFALMRCAKVRTGGLRAMAELVTRKEAKLLAAELDDGKEDAAPAEPDANPADAPAPA